jgi:hypothetical protein
MFGDLLGGPVVSFNSSQTGTHNASSSNHRILVPLLARGSFKVADNESPRPQDRVFFNFNYFNHVNEGPGGPTGMDVYRYTIGFEKTFLGGDASVEMRLPLVSFGGDGTISEHGIGDLTVIGKYAFINNRENGDVVSAGLAVTAPTGANNLNAGLPVAFHDTLLQPFVGYLFNLDRLYIHGFTELVVPTDSQDALLLFNDIGVGYWIFRNRQGGGLASGVAPTFEAHVTTPLDHRGLDATSGLGVPDWVSLTGGLHVMVGRLEMGVAVGTPVTGPRPYHLEVLAQLNFHF